MRQATLVSRLADTLYTEAMLLADETRSYLDGVGAAERDALAPHPRVLFACESLNATTRLMQAIAWLAGRRAGLDETHALAAIAPPEPPHLALLPDDAQRLFAAGVDLHDRLRRLERGEVAPVGVSPARALLQRLERAL